MQLSHVTAFWLRLASNILLNLFLYVHIVLVQAEMERWRFPLASIPPFWRGFSRHRYDHQAIPQHGCVPAEPASVSPGKAIVAAPGANPEDIVCCRRRWRWLRACFN